MSKEVLVVYAKKLGLPCNGPLLDVAWNNLQNLTSSQQLMSLKISQAAQSVISVILAAEKFGHQFNQSEARKFSGLSNKIFLANLKTVRSEFGVDKILSLEEVAVTLGCPSARAKAAKCLENYSSFMKRTVGLKREKEIPIHSNLYICSAVAVACKELKLKFDRKKLVQLSGETKAKLDDTIASLSESQTAVEDDKPNPRSKKRNILESIEESANNQPEQEEESQETRKKFLRLNEDDQEFDMVEYLTWKQKMLKLAGLV